MSSDLIDVTASAVDSGADVITQVRVLGAMADNVESSQETAQACLLIEKTMLKVSIHHSHSLSTFIILFDKNSSFWLKILSNTVVKNPCI